MRREIMTIRTSVCAIKENEVERGKPEISGKGELKPNFFIVGAQKSGTTALSEYLRSHPKICFSKHKEPHFFAEDFPGIRVCNLLEEYLNLFKECSGDEVAVGEGSTGYLQSSTAISNIYKYNPNAKLIVMLRNPVDLVYSLHGHLLFCGHEDEDDFEKAWWLQGLRRNGRRLPKDPRFHPFLQYAKVGKIGSQVERVLSVFPCEQVKIILFDDFKESQRRTYEEVLTFLGVPIDERAIFPIVNKYKIHRFPFAFKFVRKTVPWSLRCWTKEGIKTLRLKKLGIHKLLRQSVKRKPLTPDFRAELLDEFRDDVVKLSKMLDRDLSHWLVVNET